MLKRADMKGWVQSGDPTASVRRCRGFAPGTVHHCRPAARTPLCHGMHDASHIVVPADLDGPKGGQVIRAPLHVEQCPAG